MLKLWIDLIALLSLLLLLKMDFIAYFKRELENKKNPFWTILPGMSLLYDYKCYKKGER